MEPTDPSKWDPLIEQRHSLARAYSCPTRDSGPGLVIGVAPARKGLAGAGSGWGRVTIHPWGLPGKQIFREVINWVPGPGKGEEGSCKGAGVWERSLATQRVQVHFDFLPTAQHSDGGKEAPRGHNSILLPDDLAVPSEENLGVEAGRRVEQAALASALRMLELRTLEHHSVPTPSTTCRDVGRCTKLPREGVLRLETSLRSSALVTSERDRAHRIPSPPPLPSPAPLPIPTHTNPRPREPKNPGPTPNPPHSPPPSCPHAPALSLPHRLRLPLPPLPLPLPGAGT